MLSAQPALPTPSSVRAARTLQRFIRPRHSAWTSLGALRLAYGAKTHRLASVVVAVWFPLQLRSELVQLRRRPPILLVLRSGQACADKGHTGLSGGSLRC